MHSMKLCLLLASSGVTLMLAISLCWHIGAAWRAPHVWRADGKVTQVLPPPPGDEDRVPGSGPLIVVEFKDPKGNLRRETHPSLNSGGATEFAGRKVGDAIQFEVELDGPAPGSRRRFDWQNAGKVHWALGGALIVIGVLLYLF